ncbi:MAG: FHA domain-containing protein [Candidatus Electryoneaceae bacterium]|nr:FHA domain-containing protein [Candidatus Electryoneaceae bacterium]
MNERWTIGRKNGNSTDILIDDPSVSAVHGEVEIRGGQKFLSDLGSENGTIIRRGSQVIEVQRAGVPLQSGDQINFGLAKVSLQYLVSQMKRAPFTPHPTPSPTLPSSENQNDPPVRSPMRCPHCAAVMNSGASRCPSCGNPIR